MKLFIAFLLLTSGSALAVELPLDLAKAVNDYDTAQFDNDIAELDRLISDDYVLVNSDASVENKQKVLADHAQAGFKTDPYVLEQPVKKAWRDGAVVGGLARISWSQGGQQQTRVVRIAHVWAHGSAGWQITYTQVTRVR